MKFFELPALPYAEDALEPHIGAETLRVHHGKHHAGYVEKLNEAMSEQGETARPLIDVVRTAEGTLLENAAQAWNHEFYWNSMSPSGGGEPPESLGIVLTEAFGSVDAFREEFKREATSHFGSGWAWLVTTDEGGLGIVTTHDAGCPLRDGSTPLLTCDVWEHAYYIDHRNDRDAYLEAFFEVIDWQAVSKRVDDTVLIGDQRRS